MYGDFRKVVKFTIFLALLNAPFSRNVRRYVMLSLSKHVLVRCHAELVEACAVEARALRQAQGDNLLSATFNSPSTGSG